MSMLAVPPSAAPSPRPAQSAPDVWRPYEDEPVLTPAMARFPEAIPPADLVRLRRYLEAVAQDRPGPLHTAIAFNAAYFGYETGGEGYGNGAFDLDVFPVLTWGEETPAVPVGAMVRVDTGSSSKLLYAEIVYKEGRHTAATDDDLFPAWVSGAPVGASGPGEVAEGRAGIRRELLVPDLEAFGPALHLDEPKLRALLNRGRWLNADAHLIVHAQYRGTGPSGEAEEFVEHLLTVQRESLLHPDVPVSIAHLAGGTSTETLRTTLLNLLAVVRRTLRDSDVLRLWQDYALPRTRLAERLNASGALGREDMIALSRSVTNPPDTGRRRHGLATSHTRYFPVWPALRAISGAAPLLCGVEYAVSVCQANLAIADCLHSESEDGLFVEADARISLDDGFEQGGVWRAHRPGSQESGTGAPLTPAGRGWLEAVASNVPDHTQEKRAASEPAAPEPAAEEPALEPVDAPPLEPNGLGLSDSLRVNDSEITWRQPLRLAHLLEDRLPLRPLVMAHLRDHACDTSAVRLELLHPGGELDPDEATQDVTLVGDDEGGDLTDVQWPLDFFPGLYLTVQWPKGGRVVRVTTTELDQPVEVDGRYVAHAYDSRVLTRDSAPGSDRSTDSPAGLDPRRLVLRAVRRCGLLTPDGHALLDRAALPHAVYGATPPQSQADALDHAVEELMAERRLYAATGSRDTYGIPHHPAREGEARIPLVGYDPAPRPTPRRHGHYAASSGRMQTEYFVHGFLRRLPADQEPSEDRRIAYREHSRLLGKADGWELPPGYTFVIGHARSR
ncbi:hypothetical protein [Streptomyces sp. RTd22]|uniref:hypothetical protein n=1 Tax=Streptomyces sp. RTd22 TaxID=1841249 RepID=UPI000B0AA515|nr:hypothetical protein [Streptomyces sp. RTd22]